MRPFAIVATTVLAAAATAYNIEAADVQFGVVRYPEMSLYRRQSPGGCHDNTKACSNFCIANDEECCEDGTSCFSDERCQKGADGVWGCCSKGTVCLGSVTTTAFDSAAPTATSASSGGSGGNPAAKADQSSANGGNGQWHTGPIQTAAAVALGAFILV